MIYTLLTACLTAADLVTKALARRDRRIRKIYNPGFSFGHLKEHPFIVKGIPTAVGILSAVKWVQAVALPQQMDTSDMAVVGNTEKMDGKGGTAVSAAAHMSYMNYSGRTYTSEMLKKTAYSLILAGAIGNTYERVKQGYVTDFINIPKGRIRTWFFNIADLCVTAGAALMVLGELTEDKGI